MDRIQFLACFKMCLRFELHLEVISYFKVLGLFCVEQKDKLGTREHKQQLIGLP